jgi:hypothetical protein
VATNKKITELTELTGADIANDDVLAIVDVSAGTTHKIKKSTFTTAVAGVTTLTATSPLAVDASSGDVTASISATPSFTSVSVTGDTSAGDDAKIGYTSAEGLILTGQGSTNDVTIKNDADADVITIATGATNVDIVGDVTASTVNADGDTAASDNAAMGYTSAEGLILTGQGSTNDVTIKNDADEDVLEIPTGTKNVTVAGKFSVAGDTATGDDATIGYTAAEGLILTGQGSTNDVTIKNDADADVITIATGGTNVDVVGDLTAGTLNADGDTAADDNAAIGYTTAEGLILTGQGSTNDVTIKNDADADVLTIPTGTTNVSVAGNLSLSDASSVNISTPLLAGADHTYTGLSAQMLAGGAISAFDLVCIHTTTQEVVEADASAYSTARVIGIAPAAISDTATGTILLHGFIRDDTWAWTTGSTLYLSETAGAMTHTAPSTDGAFVVVIGVALSPDVVYMNPSMDVIEHA